jgi:hypothetical protein
VSVEVAGFDGSADGGGEDEIVVAPPFPGALSLSNLAIPVMFEGFRARVG